MKDETIALLYRSGPSHRVIPLLLAVLLFASAPLLVGGAGPFWWPWGVLFGLAALVSGVAALVRWNEARVSVRWLGEPGRLEFRSGRRRYLNCSNLTKVVVRPSALRTDLWVGKERWSVSHRLHNVGELLDRIRALRPDLFSIPERLLFRRSAAAVLLQGGLVMGTAATAALLAGWQPLLGWFFAAASFYVLVRILFFIPRAHQVEPGVLTNLYWLRRKRWPGPAVVRREHYGAGGALFFRMTLVFGKTRVVLDEGQFLDALEASASRVESLLNEG